MKIIAIKEDITHLKVDAIVNASNEDLEPGSGVDGAIHEAAGPKLYVACKKLDGCPTGQAVITKGYDLPAKWVIHTAGPIIWDGAVTDKERGLLAKCYQACLMKAKENCLKTIAFPAISAGAFGFPREEAAGIAYSAIESFLETVPSLIEIVYLVAFDDVTLQIYKALLGGNQEAKINSLKEKKSDQFSLGKLIHGQ